MSGPGDRAPKRNNLRKPTLSCCADGHDVTPTKVDLARSKEFGKLRESPAREPGDLGGASPPMAVAGNRGKAEPQSAGQAVEESDAVVVPKKSAKTWVTPVESMEGRAAAKGKSAS